MTASDDAALRLVADVLDDIEHVRIANENRLRAIEQGDLPEHPIVSVVVRSQVEQFKAAEVEATRALQRAVRTHPLGPWVRSAVGIGEKQGARLIAAIGDPYWHSIHDRPRRVGELWAYCGLHTLPVSTGDTSPQGPSDTGTQLPIIHKLSVDHARFDDRNQPSTDHSSLEPHYGPVGGNQPSDVDHTFVNDQDQNVYIAARRRRGARANWSQEAKMRAFLCASSCIKQSHSPYREIYDRRREATTERVHAAPCVRCGPAGKPAAIGTPWSAGHQHADALRIVSKAIIKDLWKAGRAIHESSVAQAA